jgi:glutaminyl-peptide cyclotransferase
MIARRTFCALFCLSAAALAAQSAQSKAASYKYTVVHAYPHDPKAFTQGLIYLNGYLYESTGPEGHSSLRRVDLQTGAVLQEYNLPAQYFGEGLTSWKDTLIQLTWKAQTGFVYDRRTFRLLRAFHYTGEGWGLTQDGTHLVLSDGSSKLRFLDPQTFETVKSITVTDSGVEVHDLNELEYIHSQIYANVWQTDLIAISLFRRQAEMCWDGLT